MWLWSILLVLVLLVIVISVTLALTKDHEKPHDHTTSPLSAVHVRNKSSPTFTPTPSSITVTVNTKGRFGNALIQNWAIKSHAARHGYRFRSAKWSEASFVTSLWTDENTWTPEFPVLPVSFGDNVIPEASVDTMYDGYFQNATFLDPEVFQFQQTYHFGDRVPSDRILVSVHVRRGDYEHLTMHPLVTEAYYEEAMTLMEQRLGIHQIHFVVCSDNLPVCRTMKAFTSRSHVTFSWGESLEEDFCILHACHHHIIANSSFSWVAAHLNTTKGRMVILPSPWFLGPDSPSPDGLYTLNGATVIAYSIETKAV